MASVTQKDIALRVTDHAVRLCLVAVPFGFALIAYTLGQDRNWDLRNYHWYNPYAFLGGRLGVDLGVAHVATFYNPLLDLPLYLVGRDLPAWLTGSLLGLIHGLNFPLLYGLAVRTLAALVPDWPRAFRRGVAAVLAIAGMFGGGHLALVGTTFNDNVVSLAVLGSALIVAVRGEKLFAPLFTLPSRGDVWAVAGAGMLVGAAVGLKLPTAIFAVGLCAAFLFVGGGLKRRVALALVFGIGVTTGFAGSDGPWMWMLWRDYANPLFPYFNSFFHSPMGIADSYRDLRFVPHGLGEILGFPLAFSFDPHKVGEIDFRDYRILAAYAALVITAGLMVWTRLAGKGPRRLPAVAGYLIAAAAVSYVAWLFLFAIYRYVVVLEMLAPLLMAAAILQWPVVPSIRIGVIAAALILVTATTRRGDWEHVPWRDGPFVSASVPAVADPDRTLALITGMEPVGWLVPFFPPQIPFLRLQGYLNRPDQVENGLNKRARERIAGHDGDIFLLTPMKETSAADNALRAYGLRPDWNECTPVRSNLSDDTRWCRVYRTPASSLATSTPP